MTATQGSLVVAVGLLLMPGMAAAQPPDVSTSLPFFAADPTLRGYVREALTRNPGVREAAARYRAALQEVPRVGALPDPMVTFTQALRSVETRVGPQRHTLMISQAFPWFGTLALREQVAIQTAAARYHDHVARQRDVITAVKETFYNLAYVDRALVLTQEEAVLVEQYEALARARYAGGQGLQQGVIRLQAELTRVLTRQQTLTGQRAALAARLNTLRDRAPEAPIPQSGALTLPAPPPDLDLDRLYDLGDRYRPELQTSAATVARGARTIALAEKASRPTFTLGVGWQSVGGRTDPAGRLTPPPDDGKNPLTLSLGLTIPLQRGKYRAGVEQAREELVAERERRIGTRNAMELDVRDAVLRLETLGDQIDLVERVLIPQVEETLAAAEIAYETGQLNVVDLLDSERMRLEVRLIDARHRSDYLVALAHLERAIGTMVVPE